MRYQVYVANEWRELSEDEIKPGHVIWLEHPEDIRVIPDEGEVGSEHARSGRDGETVWRSTD